MLDFRIEPLISLIMRISEIGKISVISGQ